MKKSIAEVIGTFGLVFFGCGTILFMVGDVGLIGVSFAFGLAVVAMAYGLGPISGAHLNPAVSLGVMMSGRMSTGEMLQYWAAQVVGGLIAAVVLMAMGADVGAASTTVGESGMLAAVIFELVATFMFVTVILGATQKGAPSSMAGLAIGLTLVLIHLAGIKVSGASVNPARSIATNIFNPDLIADLWIYIVAPLVGGAIAGIAHKAGITSADE
ncbi:MAG: aquaporin [Paracoccaceae bacterium]|jgi:aquaporin Z